MLVRNIPSSGETLPVLGLGTWRTFDVIGVDSHPTLLKVMNAFHDNGGKMIDSSPMYGRAEKVIGELTEVMEQQNDFFYATKVWTTGKKAGVQQMDSSYKLMNREVLDLIQIHNLVDWQTHLETLNAWKSEGKVRYTGITHYTDSMHQELENVFSNEPIDFVQFNFSIQSRHAEKRLLEAAADKGVATIINRPFGEGNTFNRTKGKAVPEWLSEFGINNWAQFFLVYIVSHPAVNCVIPATSDPLHAEDNFSVDLSRLPNEAERRKMVELFCAM